MSRSCGEGFLQRIQEVDNSFSETVADVLFERTCDAITQMDKGDPLDLEVELEEGDFDASPLLHTGVLTWHDGHYILDMEREEALDAVKTIKEVNNI